MVDKCTKITNHRNLAGNGQALTMEIRSKRWKWEKKAAYIYRGSCAKDKVML